MWLGVWHRVTSVHRCLWPLSTGVCLWLLSTGVWFWPLTTGVCLCAAVHRCLFSATDVPQCIWPLFPGVRLRPLFTGVSSLCRCPQVSVFGHLRATVYLAIVHRCPVLATVHRCLSLAAVHSVSVFGHCPQVSVFDERGFLRETADRGMLPPH